MNILGWFKKSSKQFLWSGILLAISNSALALESGDWIWRLGYGYIDIDSSSGTVDTAGGPVPGTGVEAGDSSGPVGSIGYMLTDNWGLELLLALPFEHDIKPNDELSTVLGDSGDIAKVSQLPPVFSINYYFTPKNTLRPYIGAGINYTYFSDEETKGALADAGYSEIELEDSWGLALQAGFDMDIDTSWFFNANIRWIDIETEAKIKGETGAFGPLKTSDIELDPRVFMLQIGTRF